MRLILGVALAGALAGCASSGPTGKDVLGASAKTSAARLVIYRTSALGFAVQPDYLVDGRRVGKSQPNGFVVCDLAPGRHEVSVANPAGNVNFGGGSDKASVVLKSGSTTYLVAEPKMGLTIGVITVANVPETQGRSDTAALHKTESSCGK